MAGCGQKCCVSGCDSRKDASGYSFHTFPVASELRIANFRRKLWHDAVFGKDSARIALKNTKICGKHFVTGKIWLDLRRCSVDATRITIMT